MLPLPSEQSAATSHGDSNPADQPINIETFPIELLMQILGFLAPDDAQPDLPSHKFYGIAQSDLRNVCLVSRQMDAVARPLLYQSVIVKNVDVLTYLLRTLDDGQALGQHIKRLVFEVPTTLHDSLYRRPDVSALNSCSSYSEILGVSATTSSVTKYQEFLAGIQQESSKVGREANFSVATFMRWVWKVECEVVGLMHFEVLLRTGNLQSLCFGRLPAAGRHHIRSYTTLMGKIETAAATAPPTALAATDLEEMDIPTRSTLSLVRPFLPRLRELLLKRSELEGGGPYNAWILDAFLGIPSLKTVKSVRDNGNWSDSNPRTWRLGNGLRFTQRPRNLNITHLDLERSHCTPRDIFHICEMFPSLEHLSVSVNQYARQHAPHFIGGDGKYLSTGLAKLQNLKVLVLDLHHQCDFKPWLGEHGALNLTTLNELVDVRLPLHFLVEVQPGDKLVVPDACLLLPPSLKRLTFWADMDSVRYWGFRPADFRLDSWMDSPYDPAQSARILLDSVSNRLSDHFSNLEKVKYCYFDPEKDAELSGECRCSRDADDMCAACRALPMKDKLLNLYVMPDTFDWMETICSRFEDHEVPFLLLQERPEY